MTQHVLRALLSYWYRNPLQLFAFLAGLALATALWSGVQAINAEARASYGSAASTLDKGQYDILVSRFDTPIPQETYIRLRRSGWLVSPVVEGNLNGIRLIGFDSLSSPHDFVSPPATWEATLDRIISGPKLFANPDSKDQLPTMMDIIEDASIEPGLALGDIGTVQTILGVETNTYLILYPDQPLNQPALEVVAPELRIQFSQPTTDISQLTNSFHLNLTAFGFLSFAVGLFIVHSTVGLVFEQRRAMVRSLRTMGAPLRTIISLITLEMLGFVLAGATLGILVGWLIAAALMPGVAATLQGLYGASVAGSLQLRFEWWASGLTLAFLGVGSSLSVYLWQTSRTPILAHAFVSAWIETHNRLLRYSAIGSIILLLAAVSLLVIPGSLAQGFLMLGCLLTGGAIGLPVVLSRCLSAFGHATNHPIFHWFCADTRQQLSGLSLALMALLLAVSANIGISTMVASFRLTFIGYLDQALAPELYVGVETTAEADALEAFARSKNLEILPVDMMTTWQSQGQKVQLLGIRVGNTYRETRRFIESGDSPWDRVAGGEAIIVNEQYARNFNTWLGDTVDLPDGRTLPIAAIVSDYGNVLGQVLVSEAIFQSIHPEIRALQFGLRTEDPDALGKELVSSLGLPKGAMIDQASMKQMALDLFGSTFLITGALNALTLTVAGFGIFMSLLALADRRIPQLAPVWAIGLSRSQLGWTEFARAVVLAMFVFVFAIPFGLAVAWILLKRINVAAFGWELPMYLFPMDYLAIGGLAVLSAVLAATWPTLRLMRLPPARLLKEFSSER